MNPKPLSHPQLQLPPDFRCLSAEQWAQLQAQVRTDAQRLHEEALGDLWRGADAVLALGANSAARAASRWSCRLRRHLQHRSS